jgi:hypothetical protein
MGVGGRTWGDETAAKVLAAVTDNWQGAAAIANAIPSKRVAAVMYRLKTLAAQGVIEADQRPYSGGTPMNVFRRKPAASEQPTG